MIATLGIDKNGPKVSTKEVHLCVVIKPAAPFLLSLGTFQIMQDQTQAS